MQITVRVSRLDGASLVIEQDDLRIYIEPPQIEALAKLLQAKPVRRLQDNAMVIEDNGQHIVVPA